MQTPNFVTLRALNDYIHQVLQTEISLQNIWVKAEISGFKISKGYAYFTLKDENYQLPAVCFSIAKTYQPKDGEQVLVRGSVDFYSIGGKTSFKTYEIIPYGKVLLYKQLEELKQKLLEQGYFSLEHKKPIPIFPKKVCVLTSKTGAVIRDIVSTVRKTNNVIDLYIYDVLVQGVDAAKSIIKGLKEVDVLGFDVIIIARGGGSFEDLMPFNDENLVYAIYDAKTPIISAVGHETDTSLSDLVADLRALTPTAAAQVIAYDVESILVDINQKLNSLLEISKDLVKDYEFKYMQYSKRLTQALDKQYLVNIKNLDNIQYRILNAIKYNLKNSENDVNNKLTFIKNTANNLILKTISSIDNSINVLKHTMDNSLTIKDMKLQNIIDKLSAYNPANVFKKGYFSINKEDKVIKDVSQLKVGDHIQIKGSKGKAKAKIEEVENEI